MRDLFKCKFFVFFFTVLINTMLTAEPADKVNSDMECTCEKTHVVVAMPFKPNMPFDPHWYTPEYVDYIASLLPSDKYEVTGYFVSLENIPVFLADMKTLTDQKKKICILNVCDGGEWDGYPGISVLKEWEKHPVHALATMTGADSEFIFHSDDKTKMQDHITKANLKSLTQGLVSPDQINDVDLEALLASNHLDQAWPLFCKLNIGAGALGISSSSICHNIPELKTQLQKVHHAFPKSDILIQPYLAGKEYTILVLKDRVYAAVRRDFHNTYNLMEEANWMDPNNIDDEIIYHPATEEAKNLALKAIQAIPGKHHYTRVDLRDDGKGNIYVLDINDRPGFGTPSTVSCMLEFSHLTEKQFLLDLVETAN